MRHHRGAAAELSPLVGGKPKPGPKSLAAPMISFAVTSSSFGTVILKPVPTTVSEFMAKRWEIGETASKHWEPQGKKQRHTLGIRPRSPDSAALKS